MTESEPSNALLGRLPENDRVRLGQALRRLLASGSIFGREAAQTDLYHWSHQNRDLVEEFAGLLDLKLFWDHQDRTVQAVPQGAAFLLKLKLDATLVLLALWYEFDTAIRDRGESPPVRMSAQQLNDSLNTKFDSIRRHLPGHTRLREILTLAQRKNLVRLTPDPLPERTLIEILPTLKRVIPFQDVGEWQAHLDRFTGMNNANEDAAVPDNDEETDEP